MGAPRGAASLHQFAKPDTTQNERRQYGAHFRSALRIHEACHDGRQRLVRLIRDRADGDERQATLRRRAGNVMALHVDGEGTEAGEGVCLVVW